MIQNIELMGFDLCAGRGTFQHHHRRSNAFPGHGRVQDSEGEYPRRERRRAPHRQAAHDRGQVALRVHHGMIQ